jgi:hypothetical protein
MKIWSISAPGPTVHTFKCSGSIIGTNTARISRRRAYATSLRPSGTTSSPSDSVAFALCSQQQNRTQRMQIPHQYSYPQYHHHPFGYISAHQEKNGIGNEGLLHLSKATWKNLETMGVSSRDSEGRISGRVNVRGY